MFKAPSKGALIANRFVIERMAGRGGMGTVFRARDKQGDRLVALKLLHASAMDDQGALRFEREAAVLADLHHPGVVSYVAHGISDQGQPFLAMEWLEGEDLAERLTRDRLNRSDALALLRGAALPLAAAHERGIVHRDIKPSNIFLRGGRIHDVVLLDFGIAHQDALSQQLTNTGLILGTPDYMAPEQAGAQRAITPATDVFALGCVLYECLSGRPPFAAAHVAATLGKILFADPAPLPEVEGALFALLQRMLAKDPARRPENARALLAALETVAHLGGFVPSGSGASTGQRFTEKQLVSVVLASSQPPNPNLRTLAPDQLSQHKAQLDVARASLSSYGAAVEMLADGSLVATLLPRRGVATDQAMMAARCALVLKERCPEATVALSTGRVILNERLPIGEAMDRAGQLLSNLWQEPSESRAQIVIDDVTAGLLGARFQMARASFGATILQGEQLNVDASRPLLGKPTPCVGREQELATLELALLACEEEPASRVVLITAAAGFGKSRLRHEFLRRVASRDTELLILVGRGDPLGLGSSHGLLGQAIRALCGIVDGEDASARRDKLRQRVAQNIAPQDMQHVVEFIGELCGVPFPNDQSARLRAARGDPVLMNTQVSQAVTTFFRAECAAHSVLLVLEDLHWGDALTVQIVDELLRALWDQPLMILALARPEVKELFQDLWSGRTHEIPLRGLSKKASTELARQVLGPSTADPVVAHIVDQAAGNVLFLEELIRAAADGKKDAPPETVIAMVQTRILRLDPGARQVVLAASVFGEAFWVGGLRALIPEAELNEALDRPLLQLVQLEVIERQRHSRFSSEVEYRFRHALVRDAAYGLLLEADTYLAHQRAGSYLEEIGEPDPLVLAEHFDLGAEPERAVRCYVRAAERLLERHDLQGARRCVESGLACGAHDEGLSNLRALQASIAFWMNDFIMACDVGLSVLSQLPAGSYQWCKLIGSLVLGSAQIGRVADLIELSRLLLGADPDANARTAYVEAMGFLTAITSWIGWRDLAQTYLARLAAVSASGASVDPVMQGWIGALQACYIFFFGSELWLAQRCAEEGIAAFRQVGDSRNQVAPLTILGLARAALGDQDGAEEALREGCAIAERVGQLFPIAFTRIHLAHVLAGSENPARRDEARTLALGWVTSDNPNALQLGVAYDVLARVAAQAGDLDQAETHARKASDLLEVFRPYRLFALKTLSAVLLARGRAAETRNVAKLGVGVVEEIGGPGEVALRLALGEACYAAGDTSGGDTELRKCRSQLSVRAAGIPNDAARERFLREVPENARVLALADARLGPEEMRS